VVVNHRGVSRPALNSMNAGSRSRMSSPVPEFRVVPTSRPAASALRGGTPSPSRGPIGGTQPRPRPSGSRPARRSGAGSKGARTTRAWLLPTSSSNPDIPRHDPAQSPGLRVSAQHRDDDQLVVERISAFRSTPLDRLSGPNGEVVGAPGFESRPLGDGASVGPRVGAVDLPLLWPAGGGESSHGS
jgi:hypothetical protein